MGTIPTVSKRVRRGVITYSALNRWGVERTFDNIRDARAFSRGNVTR